MRKRILSFLLLLPVFALLPFLPPARADLRADFTLATGYRADDLHWNIAGNDSNPNVLSELTWSNLQTLQATASGRALVNECLYLRRSVGYGYTFSGDHQDSDFSRNDRTQKYSRSSK